MKVWVAETDYGVIGVLTEGADRDAWIRWWFDNESSRDADETIHLIDWREDPYGGEYAIVQATGGVAEPWRDHGKPWLFQQISFYLTAVVDEHWQS